MSNATPKQTVARHPIGSDVYVQVTPERVFLSWDHPSGKTVCALDREMWGRLRAVVDRGVVVMSDSPSSEEWQRAYVRGWLAVSLQDYEAIDATND